MIMVASVEEETRPVRVAGRPVAQAGRGDLVNGEFGGDRVRVGEGVVVVVAEG